MESFLLASWLVQQLLQPHFNLPPESLTPSFP